MTAINPANPTVHPELVTSFEALSTDQKLALLWYIYTELGKSITPAAPGASTASPALAEGLFQQVLEMSQEEQLQIQRDIIEKKNVPVSREYGSLSHSTKLLFWYLLAQGMERSEVIPMPEDYQLEGQASQCLTQLQALEYSEQITVLREFVAPMGNESTEV
ncbi:orange carotenoid protein N-terminal domain-containing protein [Alkalinema pantanalense CENA528]|uniref:orange carotenoid protein N-terminal domain-containing protein n=1 Tax=Alkalinema pantanalense TaxID=1620705 RepID=UPI003D6ECADC